jgi:hypothetical protein
LYEAKITETLISELVITVINNPFNGTRDYGDLENNLQYNDKSKCNAVFCPATTAETDVIADSIIDN